MFFQKLFRKDHHHYIKEAEKLLQQERFADARHAFSQAADSIPASLPDRVELLEHLTVKISLCGTELARINLHEAEFALQQGNPAKAVEHLVLIADLTDDAEILSLSSTLLHDATSVKVATKPASHGCGAGCGGSATIPVTEEDQVTDQFLSASDRFELLINTLPGDLPARYSAMGDIFTNAYLEAADGRTDGAMKTYQALLAAGPNDILLHEIASITHRKGDRDAAEELLRQALALNPSNSLVSMSLVHLFMETGRPVEALERLESMLSSGLMQEQALLLKGDILHFCQQIDQSLDAYAAALTFPAAARAAAERMVPILEDSGRKAEAEHLYKKYLKGCC